MKRKIVLQWFNNKNKKISYSDLNVLKEKSTFTVLHIFLQYLHIFRLYEYLKHLLLGIALSVHCWPYA